MRKIYILLLCCLFLYTAHAQNKTLCGSAIPNITFQQVLRNIQSQMQPNARLNEAKVAANSYCFSAEQVKQIAGIFDNDYDRLEFCKAAYSNVADKDNFYEVYDAFAYFSSAFRLHDYVAALNRRGWPENRPNPSPTPVPVDPYKNISFPDYRMYRGKTGCNAPIAEQDFDIYLREIRKAGTDAEKVNASVNLANTQCLSAAQLMKAALLMQMESSRLNFLKLCYARCYDQGNYLKMIQVFQHQPYQDELIAFYNEQNKNNPPDIPTAPPCSISATDFAAIKTNLSKQNVQSNRLAAAKQIMRTRKCFSVLQVQEVLKLISVESYRLELAKFAYEFCNDKDNYFQVTEVLNVESYKRELMEFLENKQH